MYLVTTHIPIFVEGERLFVDDSWYADLVLARDYFAPVFGDVMVQGPTLPREAAGDAKVHEVSKTNGDGLAFNPSVAADTRTRQWPEAAKRWRADIDTLADRVRVVHASVDDPFKSMQLAGLRAGLDHNKPTVLIGFDMDVWEVLRVQFKQLNAKDKLMSIARTAGMDGWMRRMVGRASVAMLKEGLVFDRYSSWARNPKAFCHSMHSEKYLIPEADFEERLRTCGEGRPLRVGYFGRYIPRKGLLDAVEILAQARARGVDLTYHLIGWGPQREALEARASELGIAGKVVFEDPVPYGSGLHEKLRSLDALLFTPVEEDTPRMVYDAFASGLPLVTTNIPFLKRRANADHASVLFDVGDVEGGANALVQLDAQRDRLVSLSRRAREAGVRHSVEAWYGRRRDWTVEAVEAHEAAQR